MRKHNKLEKTEVKKTSITKRAEEMKRNGTKSKKYILSNPLYAINKDFQFFLMSASSS